MESDSHADIIFSDLIHGLSSREVALRPRNIESKKQSSTLTFFTIMYGEMKSVFFVLLSVSAILSLYLRDFTDALIFIVINLINLFLGTIQDFRAALATNALETLVTHSISVMRDGELVKIKSTELVPGDVVWLGPGDILPVDVYIREATNLYLDESVLTGESTPVESKKGDVRFSGTCIASGSGIGQVLSVGRLSSLEKYGHKLKNIKKSNSFSIFMSQLNKGIFFLALSCILLTGFWSVVVLHKINYSTFILYAISMLVAVVPESLAIIITMMLTREALMLAKNKVIVKHLSALEELGEMDFLLTDKTGTLTENNIKLIDKRDFYELDKNAVRMATSVFERAPMENAFDAAIISYYHMPDIRTEEASHAAFTNERGYATLSFKDGTEILSGQFYAIAQAAHADTKEHEDEYKAFESKGLRVIALAVREGGKSLPVFSGLLVFEDPLKPDAAASYKKAESLGIKVKILTGDSALVAEYVAAKLDPRFSQNEVCDLSITPVTALTKINFDQDKLYARCHPDDKLALIEQYLKEGTVGFLGEGINDALALKRADVGIAVSNATEVARDSADIILLEKSLNPISTAIHQSRRVFEHIMMYLLCTLTGNIGTLFSLTLISLWWRDIPMLPIQILLNNLLTDIPLMLLISDNLSPRMLTKPLHEDPRKLIKIIALFAFISTVYDLSYFAIFQHSSTEIVRTGWFVLSVLAELILLLSLRSTLPLFKSPRIKTPLIITLLICSIVAIALPYTPHVGVIFHFVPLPKLMLVAILGMGVIYLFVNEATKRIISSFRKRNRLSSAINSGI